MEFPAEGSWVEIRAQPPEFLEIQVQRNILNLPTMCFTTKQKSEENYILAKKFNVLCEAPIHTGPAWKLRLKHFILRRPV